jgi:hypothetical protein
MSQDQVGSPTANFSRRHFGSPVPPTAQFFCSKRIKRNCVMCGIMRLLSVSNFTVVETEKQVKLLRLREGSVASGVTSPKTIQSCLEGSHQIDSDSDHLLCNTFCRCDWVGGYPGSGMCKAEAKRFAPFAQDRCKLTGSAQDELFSLVVRAEGAIWPASSA